MREAAIAVPGVIRWDEGGAVSATNGSRDCPPHRPWGIFRNYAAMRMPVVASPTIATSQM